MIAIRFFFKKLNSGGVELERLAEQVGVSMFNSAETKFGRTGHARLGLMTVRHTQVE